MKRCLVLLMALIVLVSACGLANAAGMSQGLKNPKYKFFDSENMEVDLTLYATSAVTYTASIDGSEFVPLTNVSESDFSDIGLILVIDTSWPYINGNDMNDKSAQWIRWDNCHKLILQSVLDELPQGIVVKIIYDGGNAGVVDMDWMSKESARGTLDSINLNQTRTSRIAECLSYAYDLALSRRVELEDTGEPLFKCIVSLINPGSVVTEQGVRTEILPVRDDDIPFYLISYHQVVKELAMNTIRRETIYMNADPYGYLKSYSNVCYSQVEHSAHDNADVDPTEASAQVREWLKTRKWHKLDLKGDLLPLADGSRSTHNVIIKAEIGRSEAGSFEFTADTIPAIPVVVTPEPTAEPTEAPIERTERTPIPEKDQETIVALNDTDGIDDAVNKLYDLGYLNSTKDVFDQECLDAYWAFCDDYGVSYNKSVKGIQENGYNILMSTTEALPETYMIGDTDAELHGRNIEKMQIILEDKGYYRGDDTSYIRGEMDDNTMKAARLYATSNKLKNDSKKGITRAIASDILNEVHGDYKEESGISSFLNGDLLELGDFTVKTWMALALILVLIIAIVLVTVLMKPKKAAPNDAPYDPNQAAIPFNPNQGTIPVQNDPYNGTTIPAQNNPYNGTTIPAQNNPYGNTMTMNGGFDPMKTASNGFGGASYDATMPTVNNMVSGMDMDATMPGSTGMSDFDATVAGNYQAAPIGVNVTFGVQGCGENKSVTAVITSVPYVIGRGSDCNLKLENDAQCSRKHVSLTSDGANITLVDTSTYKNTQVNGVVVAQATAAAGVATQAGETVGVMLQTGDIITVGNHQITVTIQ